jgi:hypothetical protein
LNAPAGGGRGRGSGVDAPPAIYPGAMRKLMTWTCALAGLGTGALAVAGCGAEKVVGVDVAKAADATARKGTARIVFTSQVQGVGLPAPIVVKGTGVTSLSAARGNLAFDLKPLLALAGAPAGTSSALQLRFDGGRVWAQPPSLGALKIPGGKHWITLDLPAVASKLGLSTKALGTLFTLEPSAQLRAIRAAKGMKEVGKEDVAGASTTHYHGTYRLNDLIAGLPAAQRADAQEALASLNKLGGGGVKTDAAIPADLWIDGDGVTRRLVSTAALPAQGSQPAGSLRQQYELSDFGAKLDVTPPAASDTYDATAVVARTLGAVAKTTP